MQLRKNRGFTIVELLIVIIIIAVLATLVIVAYNGVQQKAQNSKTISAVQAYKKALLEYAIEKGTYPSLTVFQGACLGTGYPSATCWDTVHPSQERVNFNNAIVPYLNNSLLSPSLQTVGSSSLIGALFYYHTSITLDGVSNPYMLIYVLQGNSIKCPVGPVISPSSWPNFSSAVPPSGNSGTIGSSGVQCWIPMPNPSSL